MAAAHAGGDQRARLLSVMAEIERALAACAIMLREIGRKLKSNLQTLLQRVEALPAVDRRPDRARKIAGRVPRHSRGRKLTIAGDRPAPPLAGRVE